MTEKKYILNPKYVLRSEGNKVYILVDPHYQMEATLSVIHPLYAMILSFFKGSKLKDTIQQVSSFLQLSYDKVESMIVPLLDNENIVERGLSAFSPHILIEYKEGMKIHTYQPTDFRYTDVDICVSRFQSPTDIICNITMKCATSCIYCYANRKGHQNDIMPVELLKRIMQEAKEIGVLRFRLMGGEVLLYKEWKSILKKMSELGFQPNISTKVPLTEEHLDAIQELELNKDPIQISLDTMVKDHLYQMLNVQDPYYERIQYAFKLLEERGLKYVIHSVITNVNDTLEDIDSLIQFFKDKKGLEKWYLDTAKCSMYIGKDYKSYKSTTEKIDSIRQYLKEQQDGNRFNYALKLPTFIKNFNKVSLQEKKELFDHRTMCSGNLNALYILPDGKVTICEELYWHPRFLLGDLNKQSIMEIWNSQKAKDLFFLRQDQIQESSPCKQCIDFTDCRKYKHVCWRDTILAYGTDKWDYPDPSCPNAPFIEKDISL